MSLHRDQIVKKLLLFLVILAIIVLHIYTGHIIRTKQQNARKILDSIQSQKVISFKIQPGRAYADEYRSAIAFSPDDPLVTDFFLAITTFSSYRPQHDRALAQWGMQIRTSTITVNIGCYIPDLNPEVIVMEVRSDSGLGSFQSQQVYQWYQKYSQRWLTPEESSYP